MTYITLTEEQAQQIEEALEEEKLNYLPTHCTRNSAQSPRHHPCSKSAGASRAGAVNAISRMGYC